ncbi:MAG: hypothetical protein QME92_08330 [Bacillota bacterium]|nr:hypothetical protein [Bacillota bacterium]
MKRMTLVTIALLGVLAVVTVKLPSAILGPGPGIEGHDSAAAVKGSSPVSFRGLPNISPLVIKRGDPSLPATFAPLSTARPGPGQAVPQNVHIAEASEDAGRPVPAAPVPEMDLGISPDMRAAGKPGSGLEIRDVARSDGAVPGLVSSDPVSGSAPGSGSGVESDSDSCPGPDFGSGSGSGSSSGSRSRSSAPAAGAPPETPTAPGGVMDGGGVRHGFVVLDEAVRRHPLWAELASVEQEMDACKAEWQREVDASCLTQEDIDRCYAAAERLLLVPVARGGSSGRDGGDGDGDASAAYAGTLVKRLKEMEARLRNEAERRVEAHAGEVSARLEDDLYAERARLNREFDEFKEKTLKEYYLSLFNTQARLKLLKLPEEERRALQEKLAKLTVEMEMKIDAKARENDAAFAAYAEKRRAEAEADAAAFRNREEQELSGKLAGERARLEKSLAGLLSATDLSLREDAQAWCDEAVRRARTELAARRDRIARDFAAKEEAFTEKYTKLQQRRDALYRTVCDDIRAAARELEVAAAMKVSVLERGAKRPAGTGEDEDVTERVLAIIRNR